MNNGVIALTNSFIFILKFSILILNLFILTNTQDLILFTLAFGNRK